MGVSTTLPSSLDSREMGFHEKVEQRKSPKSLPESNWKKTKPNEREDLQMESYENEIMLLGDSRKYL